MSIPNITYHPEYNEMQAEVKKIRTAILGAPFVKAEGAELLPHPSSIDTTSTDAKIRYAAYLAGAEFDEFPKQTLKTIMGKMKFQDMEKELPDRLSHLIENVDNDGTSLIGGIENSASNIAAVKFHILVTDYKGLTGVDISDVSKADVAALKPRATVKQYNRESLVWWNYKRIDDAMQLTFVMLRETSLEFNQSSLLSESVESFLILALDEEGNYYQQKILKNVATGGYEQGEPDYVTVANKPLKWLPVEIISDEELTPGKLPRDLGYLAPICDLAYSRYRVSAEYKEAMRMIAPTVNVTGMDRTNYEQYKEVNGRSHIITGTGGVNLFGEGVTMEIVSAGVTLDGYEQYFKDNEAKVRALGGSFATDQSKEQTATEANISNHEQTSRLVTLAYQLEAAWRRAVLYCGMFEGLWSPDDIENNLDQVVISLNKDFAQAKLTTQERDAIRNDYLAGIINIEEALKQLERGGVLVGDAEALLAAFDGGDVNLTQEQ